MTRKEWLNKIGIEGKDDSPRLISLAEHLQDWFDQYTNDDFKDAESGIEMLVFAHDNKYKKTLRYQILNKDDKRESLIQAINFGIGDIFYDKECNELFNGFIEWLIRVFKQYPQLWENFQNYMNKENNKE